jgi:putative aldouronate transport system permease protein
MPSYKVSLTSRLTIAKSHHPRFGLYLWQGLLFVRVSKIVTCSRITFREEGKKLAIQAEHNLPYRTETKSNSKKSWSQSLRKLGVYLRSNWLLYVIAGPGLLAILLFTYMPMLGNVIAFQDYSPVTLWSSPWVGLKNFRMLTTSPIFLRLVWNTIFLNMLFIAAETISGVTLALLINEIRLQWFKRIAQSFMFLPYFIGWPVVGVMLLSFISYDAGVLNNAMEMVGLERIAYTNTPEIWPGLLAVIRIWKYAGAQCIIYLASLASIDPQLYEAAAIDGASRVQRMRFISLPLMTGIVILLVLLSIGRIFYGDVGMIYALIRDYAELYPTTDVIDTYLLRALRANSNYGFSAAVGLIQSVVGFILVIGSNWIVRIYSRRKGEDYALF